MNPNELTLHTLHELHENTNIRFVIEDGKVTAITFD